MSALHTPGPRPMGPVFDSTGRLMASVAALPAAQCCDGWVPVGQTCSRCGTLALRAAIAKATGSAS